VTALQAQGGNWGNQRGGVARLPAAPGSEEAAMSLSTDDAFLQVIAQQAQVAYATQQLIVHRSALQHWQAQAARELSGADHPRVQYELEYYNQQVERWQEYLERLVGLGALH